MRVLEGGDVDDAVATNAMDAFETQSQLLDLLRLAAALDAPQQQPQHSPQSWKSRAVKRLSVAAGLEPHRPHNLFAWFAIFP